MKILENIEDAKRILDNNEILAIKTDTVYGLVGKAFSKEVEDKIYEAKNRERNKKLILFIKDVNELKKYVSEVPLVAEDLMNKYWPGKLTLIFRSAINENDTIGIRIPNEERLLQLLNILDYPLISTSANISGEESCVSVDDVIKNLDGRIKYVLNGSKVEGAKASTVIDVSNNSIKILRQGEVYAKEK